MSLRYPATWFVYGLIVIASGCYRYLSKPDGESGLYFGLVMGGAALAAGALLRSGRSRSGHAAGFFSLIFVTGWFVYESMFQNGGTHEPRLMIVAAISLVQTAIAVAHLRKPRSEMN
jgi:hypothetical protein